MHALLRAALVAAIGSSVLAQGAFVSPVVSANSEGSGNNAFPFAIAMARRYQQIHSDVMGAPRVITRLTFRQNASANSFVGVYTYDLELFLAHARNVWNARMVFDANYLSPRAAAIPRGMLNFGPQGQAVLPGPNPFHASMTLPLTTPFAYDGVRSLLWEAAVHSASLSGGSFNALDADGASLTIGTSSITGDGCLATGRTASMTHAVTIHDASEILAVNFTVANAPANVPLVLALGPTNPAASVPGLCSSLLTDRRLLLGIGNADANGALTNARSGASTFVLQNRLGGATFYSQVHAADPGQPGIGVANSNGRENVVPMPNVTKVIRVGRVFNNDGGTAATEGVFFTSCIGFALPVQFSY